MKTAFAHRIMCLLLLLGVPPAHAGDAGSRQACEARCDQAEAQCSLAVREAKGRCAASAASGGRDPVSRYPAQEDFFCGYFLDDHCMHARSRDACRQRFDRRHALCMGQASRSTLQSYMGCGEGEREALALCRDEQADCRSECED